MIEGEIKVADLPAVWNEEFEKMQSGPQLDDLKEESLGVCEAQDDKEESSRKGKKKKKKRVLQLGGRKAGVLRMTESPRC